MWFRRLAERGTFPWPGQIPAGAVSAARTKGGGEGATGLPGRTCLPPHLVFLKQEDSK